MSKSSYSPGEVIVLLEKYDKVKKAFEIWYRFLWKYEQYTVGEHAFLTLNNFDRYRYFNDFEFPDSIIRREQFKIVLALHDTGLEAVHGIPDYSNKFERSREIIQQVLRQHDFKEKMEFQRREEQIALSMVSDDPLWQYLHNTRSAKNVAERIGKMADYAGIGTSTNEFHDYYKCVMVYFMCDAASYKREADRSFELNGADKKLDFEYSAKRKFDELNEIILKMTSGAIPFTSCVWKEISYQYLPEWVRQRDAELKSGKELGGSHFKYRYNTRARSYELQPQSHIRMPILYDPNYR